MLRKKVFLPVLSVVAFLIILSASVVFYLFYYAQLSPEEYFKKGLEQRSINRPIVAASYFEKAAEKGYRSAQYQLALMYDRGEGVLEDKEKALYWAIQSAKDGDSEALFTVAVWLDRGYGGERQFSEVLSFYELSAVAGNPKAMASLISIYQGGQDDVPADKQKAIYWRQKLNELKGKK